MRGAPILRAPISGDADCLGKRCIERDEVTCFLRLALEGVASPCSDRNLTSHALKHIALSWSSKAGISREDQASLGHHADAVRGTDAVYSFDLAIGPVQRLEAVIAQIASGEFTPDAPRSKFWNFPPKPFERAADAPNVVASPNSVLPETGGADPVEEGSDKEPQVSSESASESEAESSSSCEPDKRPRVRALLVPEPQANWHVHLKSRVLHLPYSARLFHCGKAIAATSVWPRMRISTERYARHASGVCRCRAISAQREVYPWRCAALTRQAMCLCEENDVSPTCEMLSHACVTCAL